MKSLINLLQPLSFAWLLLTYWVVRQAWKRQWRVLALPGLAWLILSVMMCTPVASLLMAGLEGRSVRVKMGAVEQADAIVCLGGGAEPSLTEPIGLHLKPGADRLSTAVALLIQKKAPVLVLGGGGLKKAGVMHSEADQMKVGLGELGIGTDAMVSLGVCADTHDEAVKTAALMKERGWAKVLLVTSAYHMPRAAGTFEKAGVSVVEVPCNYVSSLNRVGDFQWLHLPHGDAFAVFGAWFHEVIGTWVYRWRGWM
jgi:uncharacterized SAM-binding protein YcdF (DUF218 family)